MTHLSRRTLLTTLPAAALTYEAIPALAAPDPYADVYGAFQVQGIIHGYTSPFWYPFYRRGTEAEQYRYEFADIPKDVYRAALRAFNKNGDKYRHAVYHWHPEDPPGGLMKYVGYVTGTHQQHFAVFIKGQARAEFVPYQRDLKYWLRLWSSDLNYLSIEGYRYSPDPVDPYCHLVFGPPI